MFKKMRLALRKKTENGICHSSFLDLSCGLTYSLAARSSFFTSANLAAEIAPRLSVADFSLTSSITPRMSIVGSDRNETIYGTAESDVIHGLGGDVVILPLEGNDVAYGGTG